MNKRTSSAPATKGFTIIEVLVVAAITSILLSVVIAGFPKAKLQLSLSRVAYTFAQDLRMAQGMSLSSPSYKDTNNVDHLVAGYGGHVDLANNKRYLIYADQSAANQYYDVADYVLKSIDFSTTDRGIYIKEIGSASTNYVSMDFSPPNPKTIITPTIEQTYVIFALESDPMVTKTVLVNTAGLIQVSTNTILGNTHIGAVPDTDSSNVLSGYIFTTGSAYGSVLSISNYFLGTVCDPPNNKYQVGIYAYENGAPTHLVAASAIEEITPNSWNSVLINAYLTPNTEYVLAKNTNGTNVSCNNVALDIIPGDNRHIWHKTQNFDGGMPADFGTFQSSIIGGRDSTYAQMTGF